MAWIKQFILDMDGVLWRGNTPMPGLTAFFAQLAALEINFVLATNNASQTPAHYVRKLAQWGVVLRPEQVITSATATAGYLSAHYPRGEAVFVVGDEGLQTALTAAGFDVITDTTLNDDKIPLVAVGFNQHVTYAHFAKAALMIQRGATFVGTNPDVTFPHELGRLPGAGASLALLQAATGVTPIIIGKPEAIMFQEALHRLGSNVTNTAMVGDRLNTDVAGAQRVGLSAVLLLTGISTLAEATAGEVKPDWTFANLVELTAHLPLQGSVRE